MNQYTASQMYKKQVRILMSLLTFSSREKTRIFNFFEAAIWYFVTFMPKIYPQIKMFQLPELFLPDFSKNPAIFQFLQALYGSKISIFLFNKKFFLD